MTGLGAGPMVCLTTFFGKRGTEEQKRLSGRLNKAETSLVSIQYNELNSVLDKQGLEINAFGSLLCILQIKSGRE